VGCWNSTSCFIRNRNKKHHAHIQIKCRNFLHTILEEWSSNRVKEILLGLEKHCIIEFYAVFFSSQHLTEVIAYTGISGFDASLMVVLKQIGIL
jgi:hypothetical protein